MSNHLWNGCVIALSLLGLAVGVVEKRSNDRPKGKETVVPVPKRAVAVLRPTRGNKARGVVVLSQTKQGVRLRGRIRGLKPGKHGFHIHEYGDLRSPDGKSAGGHFAPQGHKHGSPNDPKHHAGDLGNITANSTGTAKVDVLAKGLKLHFVIGRSIVVHGGADDLKSQPSGNAGPRVAVGVIGFAGKAERKAGKKRRTR